jgi:hypothetical protein
VVTTNRPRPQTSDIDQAIAAASLGDARPLLKKAQRALERAKRIGNKHAASEDEAAQLQSQMILELCDHVDAAVALVEGE